MGTVRVMRSLGAALIWVLGVVLVASVSWVAINSAGRQVVDNVDVAAAGSWDGGAAPADPNATGPAASSASATPSHLTPTSSPVERLTPPPSSSAAGSTPETGSTGAGQTTTRPPVRSSPTKPAPGPVPVSATQVTAGGSVWMECTGQVVNNSLALPDDGWSASRAQHTPADLEVHFNRSTSRIEVDGTCVAGRPHFSVRSGHEDD